MSACPLFLLYQNLMVHTFRLIFSFKKCNKALLFRHFKLDTLSTVIGLITLDSYMASLDLKHAFYSIPIATEQRRYLKFVWNGQLYEFGALPMGLTSSPRIFTKVMKPPALAFLRKKGYTLTGYIDDFFLQGNDGDKCLANIKETLKVFLSLGFTVNSEKSAACTYPGIDLFGICFKLTFDDGHNVTRKERKIEISLLGSLE